MMTRREFIEALKVQTSDTAVSGTIANLECPPGRKPRERDVTLSRWYMKLSDLDRAHVNAAVREAAELAVFSFLGILDGISAIDNGPVKGDLRLSYAKEGSELLLTDPDQEYLHDSYNVLCQTSSPLAPKFPEGRLYEASSVQQLRAKQVSADGLDLHAVSPAEQTSTHSLDLPGIALPKNEHRKL